MQALAAAINDTNNSYTARKNALEELRETNKAYFGDLTLESATMGVLSQRVKDYSAALITEAVVKGQVDSIAKLSATLQKQVEVLDNLKAARERAQSAISASKPAPLTAGDVASGGNNAQDTLFGNLNVANAAFTKQRDVVDQLRVQIAAYTGELDKNIQLQIQQKPLKAVGDPDELKSIIPILEQIQRIYESISKPSKEPLFKQNEIAQELANPQSNAYQLFQAKIQEAFANGIEKGANDPKIKAAYDSLAHALQAQQSVQANPDLHAHFGFKLEDIDDKEVKQFHDDADKQLTDYMKKLPPIKSDVKVDPNLVFQAKSVQDFNEQISFLSYKKTLLMHLPNLEKISDKLSPAGLSSQDFFSGFLKILGAGLEQLGEFALSVAPVGNCDQDVYKNAESCFVSGWRSRRDCSGGTLWRRKRSKSVKAFAAGGIVTGPTLGLVGEAGPEVIFPLDRLNNFIKEQYGAGRNAHYGGRVH